MGRDRGMYRFEELNQVGAAVPEIMLLGKLPSSLGGAARKLSGSNAEVPVFSFPRNPNANAPSARFKFPATKYLGMIGHRVDFNAVDGEASRQRGKGVQKRQSLGCYRHGKLASNDQVGWPPTRYSAMYKALYRSRPLQPVVRRRRGITAVAFKKTASQRRRERAPAPPR
jgi:hypothetical protein